MADVASKQQTTALFLSTIVTLRRKHTELTNLMGNLCCARKYSVQFFCAVFYTVKLRLYGALKDSLLLQLDINSFLGRRIAKCMKLVSKTTVTSFSSKTNLLGFCYSLCKPFITFFVSLSLSLFRNQQSEYVGTL